jgi:hypothetical protein
MRHLPESLTRSAIREFVGAILSCLIALVLIVSLLVMVTA